MESKVVSFSERLLTTMFVVVLVLVVAGVLFHFASSKGIAPGVFQWIGSKTNLQAQAGA